MANETVLKWFYWNLTANDIWSWVTTVILNDPFPSLVSVDCGAVAWEINYNSEMYITPLQFQACLLGLRTNQMWVTQERKHGKAATKQTRDQRRSVHFCDQQSNDASIFLNRSIYLSSRCRCACFILFLESKYGLLTTNAESGKRAF